MRVNESNLTDQVSSTASRAAESQRIQVDSGATSFSAGAAAGDSVNLSGLAGRISQSMQALSSQSAQRAGQLQKVFSAGKYQPDAQRLASVMASF
ncbi:MAG: flagellar biosynthesis anti-sigma factor FlgM [Bryobacteraceae bacterium]|jgi:anti-sigma28 factor (negative regulator of flagellin synthesis)